METKRCSRCGEEKPITEFNKQSDHKDKLSSHCKACEAKRALNRIDVVKNVDMEHFKGNRECYLAKARKLMRGEVVDPHCDKVEGEE
jgi:NAD-dependent SIR2 family protein deacetylase